MSCSEKETTPLDTDPRPSLERDEATGIAKAPGYPKPRSRTATQTRQPPMTSYHMTLSSATQGLGRTIRKPFDRMRGRGKSHPVHPAIPSIHQSDTLPTETRVESSVDEILCADEPTTDPSLAYPQFDSIEAYVITEHEAVSKQLWTKEASRILHYIENPNLVVKFENRDYFGTGNEDGHKALSTLAERILTAISLCILDNECINVRCSPRASNRSRLKKLIQQAQVATAAQKNSDEHDSTMREREQAALFGLIDYVSVIFARLIDQIGSGHYWQATVLCTLVKRVAKVKVLLLDLAANAQLAAEDGEHVLDRSRDNGIVAAGIIAEEEECEEVLRLIAADTKEGLTSIEDAQIESYCVQQNRVRAGTDSLLRAIFMSLRLGVNSSGLSKTSYEICGLVHETGFQGFKTLLFQGRDLEYAATSDLGNLNTADSAFRILKQTVEHLKQYRKSGDPSDAVTSCRLKTVIEWEYRVAESDPHKSPRTRNEKKLDALALEYMEDIITVMVPLAMVNPRILNDMNTFRSVMLLSKENETLVHSHQETKFTAFFRMYTNAFESTHWPQSTLRLKEAFEDSTFERCRLIDPDNENITSQTKTFEQRARIMENDFVMDECSVIVPCPTYVLSVMTIAILFAAGGLVVAFMVGSRIDGVDPFNIATYTWVLSAVFILICKSMLVREWAWTDFLHFRVRCRSVSELQAVTGISAQMIIAKLLHDESGGGILVTRGPYNSVFRRRSNEGFSIDRPISPTTMLMSGLTPLKVLTPKGQALVCLDARRGTSLRIVGHQADPKEQYLVCEHVDRLHRLATEADNKGKDMKLQLLRSHDIRWKCVLGVYNARKVENAPEVVFV